MNLRWKVWYGDNSTFDSRDGTAFDAPARNVQIIVNGDRDHGWSLVMSGDFYWWMDIERWESGDIFGLWDYLAEPGPKRVLFGRTIARPVYEDIIQKALNDPELPQKTGWRPGERSG